MAKNALGQQSRDYACLADDWGKLQVIDISDPTQPRRPSFYKIAGGAFDVAISGGYLYVAAGPGGLFVFGPFSEHLYLPLILSS